MSITIAKHGDLYSAEVEPPHARRWKTKRPMDQSSLIDELLRRGCHQTDIGDAFYAADPDWLSSNAHSIFQGARMSDQSTEPPDDARSRDTRDS